MSEIFIPQMAPWFDKNETVALQKYMESGGYLTEFNETKDFEDLVRTFVGSNHAIAMSNGTVTLYSMLMVLGIGAGDQVIVPNYTMIATANAVKATGAEPVFCDVELETLCLDLFEVKSKITSRTRAVILVNANGRTPTYDFSELKSICDSGDIYILEDAAQGLGSYYKDGIHVGVKSLMGSFSFSVPKIITTGQGGMVCTNNPELANKLRQLKDFGRTKSGIDIHPTFGLNFKFTDLQAVIGKCQMTKLEYRISRKRDIYELYKKELKEVSKISLIENDTSRITPWFIEVLTEDRDRLQNYLIDLGIGTRAMYSPITSQLSYNIQGNFKVAEKIGLQGLWLPSSSQLTDKEIKFICKTIRDYFS